MRRAAALALVAVAFPLAGCDMGARDDLPSHGPPLHILATYPRDGQGVGADVDAAACAVADPDAGIADAGADPDAGSDAGLDAGGIDCGVPTDVAIELRFDRFLYPVALGAGLRVYTTDPQATAVALSAEYDPVERVVSFRPSEPLQPNVLYTAEVVPSSNFGVGLWAFDGAPLEPGTAPLRFAFKTGAGPASATPPVPPTALDCGAVITDVFKGNCTDTGCHSKVGTQEPVMGLGLHDAYYVSFTAINRVAHEADTGEVAGSPLPRAPRFGTGMPIVDPSSPATSYLLYKLLRKPENYGPAGCGVTEHKVALPAGTCSYASPDEMVALREWFSRGKSMPRDDDPATMIRQINRSQLDEVTRWIAQGATCHAF